MATEGEGIVKQISRKLAGTLGFVLCAVGILGFLVAGFAIDYIDGELEKLSAISWKDKTSVCVVLAAKGYPESYQKNDEISGIEEIFDDAYIFHAGTKKHEEKILTNGGRVLGVTALGDTLELAVNNAYQIVEKITWANKYCRTDIGKKGLNFT